jgi:hypothetical protein
MAHRKDGRGTLITGGPLTGAGPLDKGPVAEGHRGDGLSRRVGALPRAKYPHGTGAGNGPPSRGMHLASGWSSADHADCGPVGRPQRELPAVMRQ